MAKDEVKKDERKVTSIPMNVSVDGKVLKFTLNVDTTDTPEAQLHFGCAKFARTNWYNHKDNKAAFKNLEGKTIEVNAADWVNVSRGGRAKESLSQQAAKAPIAEVQDLIMTDFMKQALADGTIIIPPEILAKLK